MKKSNHLTFIYPFVVIPIFVWIGFVCSISFMESWLKFRAPHVTLPIGLGIGRIVFVALNKVEWFFAALIIFMVFFGCKSKFKKSQFFFLIPVLILTIQTVFLFPVLIKRIDLIIQGSSVPVSYVHFYYVLLEIIKVISLFVLGVIVIFRLNKCYNLST